MSSEILVTDPSLPEISPVTVVNAVNSVRSKVIKKVWVDDLMPINLSPEGIIEINQRIATIYEEIESYKEGFLAKNNGTMDYGALETEMRTNPEWVHKFDFLGYAPDVFVYEVLGKPLY